MSRLSIRARLTLAFAAALLLVLALAAVFVYLRVSDSLTGALDDRLETQFAELARSAAVNEPEGFPLPGPADAEDGFSQLVEPDGTVVASTPEGLGPALDAARLESVAPGATETFEEPVRGVDGEARIIAGRLELPDGGLILVAGASTDDRAEALTQIVGAFAIGAPLAILLASGLGYLLAARALAPVESIRRRAGEITLSRSGERLPLPGADDEIRRLAETLNEMLDRIERSLERERVFVADASHELRTPLAVLRAELELALRPGRDPEEMRAALRSAVEETDRLSRLAEDLLVLARSDRGALPIRRERTELAPLVERVRDRFAARAEAASRLLTAESPDGLVADLDPLRVEQALANLVDNALAHGSGAVRLRAEREEGSVRIDVSDEGAGFPAGFEPRAFERFTRADEGRTGGGAGLGLAIVRAVAEAHGGRAEIEGRPGGGAAVALVLPG